MTVTHTRNSYSAEFDGGSARFECAHCTRMFRVTRPHFGCPKPGCDFLACKDCCVKHGKPHDLTEELTFVRRLASTRELKP